MKIKILLIIVLIIINVGNTFAQKPKFHFDFEANSATLIRSEILKEDAKYSIDLQQPQYSAGIKGQCLDLSANAILRMPMKLSNEQVPVYSKTKSFSFMIWVKTKPNASMGTPIAGNKITENPEATGWQLNTQENGAWSLNLSDGKKKFDYIPTAQRQKINDGKWHQIAFSINHIKQEVWMYFDGRNVAIYNISGLKNTDSPLATVIGGSDEKWEYDSTGQWNAFNGYIDEARIWNRAVSAKEVADFYFELKRSTIPITQPAPSQIKVMAWNIWHGGHRYGKSDGLQRVIETIKSSNADIVGLIETYGSGEEIADSLGYYFYLVSSNLSIMSRFPIIETIKAFKSFNFGGVKLQLGQDKELVFFNTWLHYLPDYGKNVVKGKISEKELIEAEGKTRHAEIKQILKEIEPWITNNKNNPIIMSGDFNSGSHLDWTKATKQLHYDQTVAWPVSTEMLDAGFSDSFRELNINPLIDPGLTWTPRAATSSDKYGLRDRIDFIYYLGNQLKPIESKVVDYHPIMFPSDHAAVVTVFQYK